MAVTWLLVSIPAKARFPPFFFPLHTRIMEDDELKAIRARRMAELQAQSGNASVSVQQCLLHGAPIYVRVCFVFCRVLVLVLEDRLEWVVTVATVHRMTRARKSE